MHCSDCTNQPSFLCRCENLYFCEVHFGKHLKLGGNHEFIMVDSSQNEEINLSQNENQNLKIDENQIYLMKQELMKRIKELEDLKKSLRQNTKLLINDIESRSNLILKNVNDLIIKYNQYFIHNELKASQCEEIGTLINSELIFRKPDFDPLKSRIQNCYSNFFMDSITSENYHVLKRRLFLESHIDTIECVSISRDALTLVTGSSEGSVRFWDIGSKKQIACFFEHTDMVKCLFYSHDNKFVASGSSDKTVILWNAIEKSKTNTYFEHSSPVQMVSMNDDSSILISVTYSVNIWKIDSEELIRNFDLSGDAKLIEITSSNLLFIMCSNLMIYNLNSFVESSFRYNRTAYYSFTLTKNETFIILGGYKNIELWNIDSFKNNKNNYPLITLLGHENIVNSVSLTENEKMIVSGSEDNTIILWDSISSKKIYQFYFHNSPIIKISVCNDCIISLSNDKNIGISRISSISSKIFLTSRNFNSGFYIINNLYSFGRMNEVVIYDSYKKTDICVFNGHIGIVAKTYIFSDMNLIISASNGTWNNLILWSLNTKSIVSILNWHNAGVVDFEISNNEKYGISGDDRGWIILWDIENFEIVYSFNDYKSGEPLKFSNNSEFVVFGSLTGVSIWYTNHRTFNRGLSFNYASINKILFTSDNKYIILITKINKSGSANVLTVSTSPVYSNQLSLPLSSSIFKYNQPQIVQPFLPFNYPSGQSNFPEINQSDYFMNSNKYLGFTQIKKADYSTNLNNISLFSNNNLQNSTVSNKLVNYSVIKEIHIWSISEMKIKYTFSNLKDAHPWLIENRELRRMK